MLMKLEYSLQISSYIIAVLFPDFDYSTAVI